MVNLLEHKFISLEYNGLYEISGSALEIKRDSQDTLDDWIKENSIFYKDGEHLIFYGNVLVSISTEMYRIKQLYDIKDKQDCKYNRGVYLKISPPELIPSEIKSTLDNLGYKEVKEDKS